MSHPRILILLLAASLVACATQSGPSRPGPAASPAPVAVDDASAYGLFLAGESATHQGRLNAAAAYLDRAAVAEGGPSYLKVAAFRAALRAGDVAGAAAMAPDGEDVSAADRRLGVLVRAVQAMVVGRDKEAYGLLSGPDIGFPYKGVSLILAPFAAAGAGDATVATARPRVDDSLSLFVASLDQAELAERFGKQADAEAEYKTLMQGGDASGLITGAYGRFLERRGRAREAEALYKARLEQESDDPVIAGALARVQKHGRAPPLGDLRQNAAEALIIPAAGLMAQKQADQALAYLRLALALDPDSADAWVLVGDLIGPTDVETARAAYARVSSSSPRYATARGKLAWSYENANDHETALKLARETLATLPDSREAAVTLADLLRANNHYTEAAATLTKLIEAPGAKPDWRLYYLRASAYDQSNQPEKTEADLQAALKLDPDEPELLNFQGYFWIDRGEHLQDALSMVRKAVAAQPRSGAMIDSLGWAYYRLGDYKKAVEQLEQAVTLEPGVPEINDHLGDAYWRVGRKTEARFQWARVLSLQPEAPLKTRVGAKLASPAGLDAPAGPPVAVTATP